MKCAKSYSGVRGTGPAIFGKRTKREHNVCEIPSDARKSRSESQ